MSMEFPIWCAPRITFVNIAFAREDDLQKAVTYTKHNLLEIEVLLETCKLARDIFRDAVKSEECHLEAIKLLLDYGIDPIQEGVKLNELDNLHLREKGSRLHLGIISYVVKLEECKVDVIRLLLKHGAKLEECVINDAVKSEGCKLEVIELLLDHGARINECVVNDAVRLEGCKVEVIKFLLDHGVEFSSSSMKIAAYTGCNLEIIKLLFDDLLVLTHGVINYAALSKRCNFEVIKFLVDHGAELNDGVLNCALQSEGCNLEVIKFLLDHGAQLDCEALILAVRSKGCNFEVIKFLVDHGAELNDGVLNIALQSEGCNLEVIKFLLDHGAQLDREALILAVLSGCKLEVIKLLVYHGAKLDKCVLSDVMTSDGCKLEVIKFLLECGVEVNENIFNSYRITSSNVNISKVLLQYLLLQMFRPRLGKAKYLCFKTIFGGSNFENETLSKEMCIFFYALENELMEMMKDNISHEFTLFSYVSDRCANALALRENPDNLLSEILLRLSCKKYVSCCDLLYATFSKYDVLCKLCELDIFKTLCEDKVSLNIDCIKHLASYLSKYDILHLIFAFWNKDISNVENDSSMKVKRQKLG